MILMWLGSLVVMLFGLNESQKRLGGLLSRWVKGLDSDLKVIQAVILESSAQRTLYTGMALYNLRIMSLRPSVLMFCLSTLGSWWSLLLISLFLRVNGFLILGLSSVFLLSVLRVRGGIFFQWLFASGLFLLGGELMLRQSSVLSSILGQSEWAFFLADGRFIAVGSLFIFALLLSLILEIEFWSLAFGLALLASNSLSFNGALALFAGERVGRVVLFAWRTRNLNRSCRSLGRYFFLVSGSGAVLGLCIAGTVKGFTVTGGLPLQEKNLILLALSGLILFVQFVAQMSWGHFAARMKVDELQEARYIPWLWIEQGLLSTKALAWARGRVQQRLSEIRYHLQGLSTVKAGQIPELMQSRLKNEEEQLAGLLQKWH